MLTKRALFFIYLLFSICLLAEDAVIWYPGGNAANSAAAIQSALSANSKTSVLTTSLSGYTLSNYDYLFICLGIYSNNYELSDGSDIDAVINFLSAGGNVYMEGGDTWAWDFPTDLHGWFNLYGEADGQNDLGVLHGMAFCSDLGFGYGGSQQHVDRLVPLDGAVVIFANENPAYAAAVANDDAYRTIGASFEFGGLTDGADSKNTLMGRILDFFDHGYAGSKPAPLNLQAFENFDNAVPLMWDAPPGQTTLSSQSLAPTLTTSIDFIASIKRNMVVGRPRQSSTVWPSLSKISAVGYQADSYTIYRSTSENGSYSQIASNVNRNYYRDENVTNGSTYYYYVKGVYDGSEGEASLKTSAQPSPTNSATSPWKFVTPEINGHIQADEWENATAIDITAPNESNAATLYVFNDDNYLYLSVDDPANTSLNTDDQFGFNVDKNLDFEWSSSLTDEGTFWFSWDGAALQAIFRGLGGFWPLNMAWDDPTGAAGISAAASTAAGHVQYEMKIDLTSSVLDVTPGQDIGLFLYSLNMPDSTFTASWPNAVSSAPWRDAWMAPSLYAILSLESKSACPFIADDENISGATFVSFNEFGDGRLVEMSLSHVAGQGDMTITQTNDCLMNPINEKYINCTWSMTHDEALTEFIAEVTFHFNENDVAGLDKSNLKVHRWNGSTWQYEGGVVDVVNNTITFSTNFSGEFALFERDHVKVSVNALLQGAYDGGAAMTTALATAGHIPLTSPFVDARIVGSIPTEITDWVSIELRSAADGETIAQRSFLLKNVNPVVDWDAHQTALEIPDAVDGAYFVVLRHRNHLPAMSAAALSLSSAAATLVDLTSVTHIYANDAPELETGVYGLYAGDADGNGQVQNNDKNDYWMLQNGSSGYWSGDFNLDGQVNATDLNGFWQPNAGRGTKVP